MSSSQDSASSSDNNKGKYLREEAALYQAIQKTMPYYVHGMPFLPSQTDFEASMPKLVPNFHGEFCWSTSYDPDFIAELMYNGFLTMAMMGLYEFITPKLHVKRSLIHLKDLPKPHGSTVKKSKKFVFTAETCFAESAKGIQKQHGSHCWFYPKLTQVLAGMNARGDEGLLDGKVRVHSFEVWMKNTGPNTDPSAYVRDGYVLVAGECGYSVGRVYTSLSGFTRVDAAGTVQMYSMACHLKRLGFEIWDLGMQLGYKDREFGAKPYPRAEFIGLLQSLRDQKVESSVRVDQPIPCKDLVSELRSTGKDREGGDLEIEE